MAQRYRGEFSPEPGPDTGKRNPFRGQPARRVNVWARILFFAPIPLFFAGLGEVRSGDAIHAAMELGAFGLLMLGAWLLNEGLRAEDAYNARAVARPPAIPRKLLSLVSIALGVGIANLSGNGDAIAAGLFALIAAVAQALAFGFDPRRRKGMEGMDEFAMDRVARAVDKAEATVAEMLDAAARIPDRTLRERVETIARSARDVFRTVEDDPRDLTRARKFMTVYLYGARDATVKFADLWSRTRDAEVRAKFEGLLDDLEKSFGDHRAELLLENRTDLDVEIEVLSERLKQEGIPARSGEV